MPKRFLCADCKEQIVTYMCYGEEVTCNKCGTTQMVPDNADEIEGKSYGVRQSTIKGETLDRDTDYNNDEAHYIVIKDIRMRFGSMVVFMIKWAFASIPAIFVVAFVLFIAASMFGAVTCSAMR